MEERKVSASHKVAMEDRKQGLITGVTDVLSFDETLICVNTCAGKMVIQGGGLTLTRLDLERGEIDIGGTVDAIAYSGTKDAANKSKKKRVRRWFR